MIIVTCFDCDVRWENCCPLCKSCKGIELPDFHDPLKPKVSHIRTVPRKREKKAREPIKIKKRLGIVTNEIPVNIENFFIATVGEFKQLSGVTGMFNLFFQSKGSQYFTNEAKDTLIRKSDHWGYDIRFCHWFLSGYKRESSWKWIKKYGNEKRCGIIKFTELKNITQDVAKVIEKEFESRHPI